MNAPYRSRLEPQPSLVGKGSAPAINDDDAWWLDDDTCDYSDANRRIEQRASRERSVVEKKLREMSEDQSGSGIMATWAPTAQMQTPLQYHAPSEASREHLRGNAYEYEHLQSHSVKRGDYQGSWSGEHFQSSQDEYPSLRPRYSYSVGDADVPAPGVHPGYPGSMEAASVPHTVVRVIGQPQSTARFSWMAPTTTTTPSPTATPTIENHISRDSVAVSSLIHLPPPRPFSAPSSVPRVTQVPTTLASQDPGDRDRELLAVELTPTSWCVNATVQSLDITARQVIESALLLQHKNRFADNMREVTAIDDRRGENESSVRETKLSRRPSSRPVAASTERITRAPRLTNSEVPVPLEASSPHRRGACLLDDDGNIFWNVAAGPPSVPPPPLLYRPTSQDVLAAATGMLQQRGAAAVNSAPVVTQSKAYTSLVFPPTVVVQAAEAYAALREKSNETATWYQQPPSQYSDATTNATPVALDPAPAPSPFQPCAADSGAQEIATPSVQVAEAQPRTQHASSACCPSETLKPEDFVAPVDVHRSRARSEALSVLFPQFGLRRE